VSLKDLNPNTNISNFAINPNKPQNQALSRLNILLGDLEMTG
jgi:hypothetical protein